MCRAESDVQELTVINNFLIQRGDLRELQYKNVNCFGKIRQQLLCNNINNCMGLRCVRIQLLYELLPKTIF